MKTYIVHTPWEKIIIEANSQKQARIDAVKQLLYEIEDDCGASLDIEEVEEEENNS